MVVRVRCLLFVCLCVSLIVPIGGGIAEATAAPTSRPMKRGPVSRPASRPAPSSRQLAQRKAPPKRAKPTKLQRLMGFTRAFLARVLLEHGRDRNNPWLLAHSLLAFGKGLKLKDGTLAIDRIVSGYLRFRKIKGKEVAYFPRGTNKLRIQPHPHMHVKTFLELGVPMNREFRVGERKVTLRQLYDSALLLFPYNPKGGELAELAWFYHLLYGRQPNNGKGWVWMNAKNEQVNFLRLIWRAFHHLDRQTSFLRVLQSRGVKTIQKKKQYIYNEACGGFHLMQSAMLWMGHPSFRSQLKGLLSAQIELMFYRLDGEVSLYTSLFRKYQRNPGYRFVILLQQLKFLGHWVETVGKLYEWKLLKPTKKQRKKIRHALHLMCVTVLLLNRLGFYKNLPRLRKVSFQFYLDLLGDSAHALHALNDIHNTPIYSK